MASICKCKFKDTFIVLQDFWLDFKVKIHKGQIIHGPVSPRWFELRLIAKYNPEKETAELAAKKVVENSGLMNDKDVILTVESEVIKKPSRKKRKEQAFVECPKCVLEIPEKSEIILSELENM